MALRLETLGTFRIVRDGREVDCPPDVALPCALLVYLGLESGAERGEVLDVFWPDQARGRAAPRLDRLLAELETLVPGAVTARGSRLEVSDAVEVDALEMCDACREGDTARAMALHDSPFLGPTPPAVSRAFDDWMAGWSEHLEDMYLRARRRGGWRARFGAVARRIRDRHVVPWTLAYIAGSWIVLEAANLLSESYGWERDPVPTLFLLLAFGVLTTITLAWFHGAAGWQRVTRTELAVHLGILVAFLVTVSTVPPPDIIRSGDDPPPVTHVAVLPIGAGGDGTRPTALAADLTERIVRALDAVPALTVLSASGVPSGANGSVEAMEVPIDVPGAGAVAIGRLTILGDSLSLSIRLLDPGTREYLGSWGFTRPTDPAPSVAAWASEVADSIRLSIGSEVRHRRLVQGATVPAALTLYQQARTIMEAEAAAQWIEERERGVGLLEEADSLAARAERLDPDWAAPTLLRAEIADVKSRLLGGAGSRDLDVLQEAVEHATRALDRGADSAAALEIRGSLELTMARHADVEQARGLLSRADTDLRKAVRLDGERSRAWWALSRLMAQRGSNEGAYEFAEEAYQADSFLELAVPVLEQLVGASLNLRRIDEAIRWWEELRRVTPSDQGVHQKHLLILASITDAEPEHVDAALASTDSLAALGLVERRDSWIAHGHMMTAIVAASAGLPDSAEALIRRARPVMQQGNETVRAAAAYFEAVARLRMGDRDAAIPLLRRYVEILPSSAQGLATDWWFEDLRGDPRFTALFTRPTEAASGG